MNKNIYIRSQSSEVNLASVKFQAVTRWTLTELLFQMLRVSPVDSSQDFQMMFF